MSDKSLNTFLNAAFGLPRTHWHTHYFYPEATRTPTDAELDYIDELLANITEEGYDPTEQDSKWLRDE